MKYCIRELLLRGVNCVLDFLNHGAFVQLRNHGVSQRQAQKPPIALAP